MNHSTVNIAFFVSLLIVMPIGLGLMILWARRILKPLSKSIEKSGMFDLQMVSFKTLVFMTPGLLAFLVFSIPVIYFGYLRKQETYCRQLIEVNKLTATNPDLQERCGMLDIDELLENSRTEK